MGQGCKSAGGDLFDAACAADGSTGPAHARLTAIMMMPASALHIFSGNDIFVIETIKSQATVVYLIISVQSGKG